MMSLAVLAIGPRVCPLALFRIKPHVMCDAISVISCNIFVSFLFWSKFLQLKIVFVHIQLDPISREFNVNLLMNWSVGSDPCSRIPDYYLVTIFSSIFPQGSIIRSEVAGRQLLKIHKQACLDCSSSEIERDTVGSQQAYPYGMTWVDNTVPHFIGSYCSLCDVCKERIAVN